MKLSGSFELHFGAEKFLRQSLFALQISSSQHCGLRSTLVLPSEVSTRGSVVIVVWIMHLLKTRHNIDFLSEHEK